MSRFTNVVFLAGFAPSGNAEVAAFFGQFGQLHPSRPRRPLGSSLGARGPHICSAGESAVFVNYLNLETTMAVMAAHEGKQLRIEGLMV